jgi:pimeloyl-ACP methyl ester carboxylesterase
LSGEVEGAEFGIYLPAERVGKTLIMAHGYWPESMPNELNDAWLLGLAEALVAEGWVVATSAYRRNGWIMEDAARDLRNLHALVSVATGGDPGQVYLMGESMGGGIATLLAEQSDSPFHGVLAMGAYLYGPIGGDVEDPPALGAHLSLRPQRPILYLTNVTEIEGPQAYVSAAADAAVPPVLWSIDRSGHVNLNEAEQRAALEALVAWVEEGEVPASIEATQKVAPPSTATFADGRATGEVIRRVPIFGNFITSFVPEDFQRLGIELGDVFLLSVADQEIPILLGETYNDVPTGEWVGFWEANGHLLICRNYRNAVQTLGVEDAAVVTVWAGSD